MKKQIKTLIISLIALYGGVIQPTSISAQAPHTSNIEAMIQDAESQYNARVGLSLIRLSDKKKLYEYRVREGFTPASVVKILSTGAALRQHGRRYRFATEVYVVGKIEGNTLNGGLLLRGCGDPSTATNLIPGESYRLGRELSKALSERGIKHITGGLYLDASMPTSSGAVDSWEEEDLDQAYGAGLFGLNWGDNRQGSRSNKNPAESLGQNIETSLRLSGISLGKGLVYSYEGYEPEGILLYTHYSQSLEKLASITNHQSMNLYAEGIGRIVDEKTERGRALSHYWQRRLRLGSGDISLADGSGLSRANKLSPHGLAMALQDLFGGQTPEDGILLETLPRLGWEGTLRSLMPYTKTQAYLKSGTMRRVSSYAGYVYYGGEWYALVYLTNGFPRATQARGLLTALIEDVFFNYQS